MKIHINDILAAYTKLQDKAYVHYLENHCVRTSKWINGKHITIPAKEAIPREILFALIMLRKREIDKLPYTLNARNVNKYAVDKHVTKLKVTYYTKPHEVLLYEHIEGIDKSVTKKSLHMFDSTVIDKLFEANGIAKRTVTNKLKKVSLDTLNAFTLTIFKEAYKPNTLPFTELKRLLHQNIYNGVAKLNKEWSDAIFNRVRPSKASYRFIHDSTADTTADIFNHIVVVGQKDFNTPVDNYIRYTETEKHTLITSIDLSTEQWEILTKGAIQAPLNSPVYNHIVKALANYEEVPVELNTYITRLTEIKDKIGTIKDD